MSESFGDIAGEPDVASKIAAEIMSLSWACISDADEQCSRYGQLQEIVAKYFAAPAAKGGTEDFTAIHGAFEKGLPEHVRRLGAMTASPPPPAGAAGGGSDDLGALSAGARDYSKDFQLMLVRIIQRHRNGRDLTETLAGAADLLKRKGSLSPFRGNPNEAPAPEIRTQGEPVAWAWEKYEAFEDYWLPRVAYEKPHESARFRNIRPLYSAPAAPRSGSGVTVEGIADAIDAVEVGYSITLTSLTSECSVYTLVLGDGSEPRKFNDRDDAREFALRHCSLIRAKAVLALLQSPRPGEME